MLQMHYSRCRPHLTKVTSDLYCFARILPVESTRLSLSVQRRYSLTLSFKPFGPIANSLNRYSTFRVMKAIVLASGGLHFAQSMGNWAAYSGSYHHTSDSISCPQWCLKVSSKISKRNFTCTMKAPPSYECPTTVKIYTW